MREYDDHIRLYTPILQRIIILVAVIIAVPVVLWTITAFVRAYVAPPTLPTFRPLAASQTPAPSPPVKVAAQTPDPTTATDARASLLEIKKPAASDPSAQPANAAPAAPQMGSTAAPATGAAPVAVPPPPFAATRATPSTIAAPPNTALANVTPQPAPPPASAAWPNPVAAVPAGGTSPQSGDAVASAGQIASNDAGADDLPPGQPLKGKIPLPPHRPKIAALTNVALAGANMSSNMSSNTSSSLPTGLPSSVPLPRARPSSAPEATPVETSHEVYDPSQIH
jgi:hypothetical protein